MNAAQFGHGTAELSKYRPDECIVKVKDNVAVIHAASLEVLVELLYHPAVFHKTYHRQLIHAFHNADVKMIDVNQKISEFIDNFKKKMSVDQFKVSPNEVIETTIEFYNTWNHDFPHDFLDGNDVNQIREQVHKIFSALSAIDINQKYASSISSFLQTIDSYYYEYDVEISPKEVICNDPVYVDINYDESKPFPLRTDPTIIAEHFKYVELLDFLRIEGNELIQCAWGKDDRLEKAPHIAELTNHFNKTSLFVSYSILSQRKLDDRVNILEAWLRIMNASRQINNFNLLFEIEGAISNPAISRLKDTWKNIDSSLHQKYKKLFEITSPVRKFEAYHKELMKCDVKQTVPYIGPWLTSMSIIGNDEPTFIELPNKQKGLNLYKQKMIFESFYMIQQPWGSELTFKLSKKLHDDIIKLKETTSEQSDLFKMSLKCEPDDGSGKNSYNISDKKKDKYDKCAIY